ncbi:MAG: hypothetical protein HQM13_00815 [SAR324 cluster bacterium]|nr:hypothetical protein [SAR324 cluster bacterium]
MTEENDREVHPMQKLLDNDFLLLAIHVGISMLSYTVWGLIDLMSLPIFGS